MKRTVSMLQGVTNWVVVYFKSYILFSNGRLLSLKQPMREILILSPTISIEYRRQLSESHEVTFFQTLWRFPLHQWEDRLLLWDTISLIQYFPLLLNVSLFCCFLLFLSLCLLHDLLILLYIDIPVGSIHRIGDCDDCLMPMLLLVIVEKSSNNDWICYVHISFHHLLN